MLNEKILIRSSIWLGFGSITHSFLVFILIIILARFGRASELGIFYTLLHIFFNVTYSVSTLINTMYMKHLRKFAALDNIEKFKEMTANSIATSVVYSFFAIIIFLIMARFLFLTSRLSEDWFLYSGVLILAIPFQILSSRISSSLLLLEKFKEVVFLQKILSSVLRLGLVIIFLVILKLGLYGAIISQSVAIIALGLVAIFLIREILPGFKFKNIEIINIKKPSSVGLTIAFSATFLKSIDLITVALLFGFRSLGHYISVLFLPSLIYVISTAFFTMFYQVAAVSRLKGKDISKATQLVTKWMLILVIILAFFVIHFADEIVFNFLGHKFDISQATVLLLSLAFSLKAMSFVSNDVLFAYKYYMEGSLINGISAVIFVLATIFTYKNGTFGIAEAFLLSSLVEFLLREIYQYKKTGISPINVDIIKVILGGGIAGFVSYFIPNPIFSYILFLMLFIFLLIITKTLRKKGLFYHI